MDKTYNKIVDKLRFDLSSNEYKELIGLEYAIGQGYYTDNKNISRCKFLSTKRNPPYFN